MARERCRGHKQGDGCVADHSSSRRRPLRIRMGSNPHRPDNLYALAIPAMSNAGRVVEYGRLTAQLPSAHDLTTSDIKQQLLSEFSQTFAAHACIRSHANTAGILTVSEARVCKATRERVLVWWISLLTSCCCETKDPFHVKFIILISEFAFAPQSQLSRSPLTPSDSGWID